MINMRTRMFDSTTIINAVASIENTTGRTSDPFNLEDVGRDSFVLQLAVTPTGTDDDLVWELRPNTFGATTFLTTPLQIAEGGTTSGPTMIPLSGTIANPGVGGATYQMEFSNVHADIIQLYVASGGATDTYTVTAKCRTIEYGP